MLAIASLIATRIPTKHVQQITYNIKIYIQQQLISNKYNNCLILVNASIVFAFTAKPYVNAPGVE